MARACLLSALMALLLVGPAATLAQSVPLPMEKPGASEAQKAEDTEDAEEAPDAEDATAAESCMETLEAAGIMASPAPEFGGGEQCVLEDPVVVEAIGTHTGKLGLPGRPTLECGFAAVFGDWLREVVNPVAASLLGAHVDAVITGPGHQCRPRAEGGLSEHGIGNAVDISAIRLVDGRSIRIESLVDAEGAKRDFLRAISASACGYFTTVLGPGSDAAHADHLHIDLAERRMAEFRICMAR